MQIPIHRQLCKSRLSCRTCRDGLSLLGRRMRRVEKRSTGHSGYQLLWVVGFIWTFGNFLRYVLLLAGVDADATNVRLAEMLAWSSTRLGPVTIGRFLQ